MKTKSWFLTIASIMVLVTSLWLIAEESSRAPSASGQTPPPMEDKATEGAGPLSAPAQGSIPVAFLISEGAVMIDFAGPWDVFQDVHIPDRVNTTPFHLYTVAQTTKPIHASGGMKIIPDYTIANAPTPKILVIPAQGDLSDATKSWVRKVAKTADLSMSVCTGSFALASTGLLSGKPATTHHSAYVTFANQFPDIQVKRGARFVEAGNLATSGGLSSGIDLALRVVERYFGHEVARQTAFDMEYQGEGWMNAGSNSIYAQPYAKTDDHPVCPVCGMAVDPATAPKSVYKGVTYYFGSEEHKREFDADPDRFLKPHGDR
jgi:YHS domain-containing protein/putative intracellular protease/amidase